MSNGEDNTKSKPDHDGQAKITYTKKGHLSANDLSPQKTVAVITAYAGKRYSGDWANALRKGRSGSLQVNLINQDNYSYMKEGSGVAYMVTEKSGYTLKQDGKNNTYYLYSNGRELEATSMKHMVDYLNKYNSDSLVEDLAKNAKVNDERSSFDGSEADSSEKKSNIQGDKGLFNVPAGMQGTWYTFYYGENKLQTLNISENKMSGTGYKQPLELHKIDSKFFAKNSYFDMTEKYKKATRNWGMASLYDKPLRGIYTMNIRSWMQGTGDGEYYGLHSEKGQTVLVAASGAGAWADCVYWKTPQLAKQYRNVKFKDIKYRNFNID